MRQLNDGTLRHHREQKGHQSTDLQTPHQLETAIAPNVNNRYSVCTKHAKAVFKSLR